jgi:hypothetical protein
VETWAQNVCGFFDEIYNAKNSLLGECTYFHTWCKYFQEKKKKAFVNASTQPLSQCITEALSLALNFQKLEAKFFFLKITETSNCCNGTHTVMCDA